MFKMETKQFKKQKWKQICWTPCISLHTIQHTFFLDITKKEEVRRGKEACGKPNNDDDEEVECGIVKEIQK